MGDLTVRWMDVRGEAGSMMSTSTKTYDRLPVLLEIFTLFDLATIFHRPNASCLYNKSIYAATAEQSYLFIYLFIMKIVQKYTMKLS